MEGTKKKMVYVLCVIVHTGMQKIWNLGPYVLDAQGSRKHDGEWPNKPSSHY